MKAGGVQWPNMGMLRCRSPNAYGRFETKRLSMTSVKKGRSDYKGKPLPINENVLDCRNCQFARTFGIHFWWRV